MLSGIYLTAGGIQFFENGLCTWNGTWGTLLNSANYGLPHLFQQPTFDCGSCSSGTVQLYLNKATGQMELDFFVTGGMLGLLAKYTVAYTTWDCCADLVLNRVSPVNDVYGLCLNWPDSVTITQAGNVQNPCPFDPCTRFSNCWQLTALGTTYILPVYPGLTGCVWQLRHPLTGPPYDYYISLVPLGDCQFLTVIANGIDKEYELNGWYDWDGVSDWVMTPSSALGTGPSTMTLTKVAC